MNDAMGTHSMWCFITNKRLYSSIPARHWSNTIISVDHHTDTLFLIQTIFCDKLVKNFKHVLNFWTFDDAFAE